MSRVSFRCDEDLLRRVDERRRGVPRERWLRAAVEFALTVDAYGPFRSGWGAQVAPKYGPDEMPPPRDLRQGGCPTTQEAVIERELEGEMGCPICGRTAEDHRPEWASELSRRLA